MSNTHAMPNRSGHHAAVLAGQARADARSDTARAILEQMFSYFSFEGTVLPAGEDAPVEYDLVA